MSFYLAKTISMPFDRALEKVIGELKKEGFGIITEIDVAKTMKEKLDIAFRRYLILGVCNPGLAHKALEIDDKVGLMLPCNVIVQELAEHVTEVAAIDPRATVGAVGNPALEDVAKQIGIKLENVIGHV